MGNIALEEIKEIRSKIGDSLEIESFVHGAMCISYSGRCLLSNYFTGHDANHGECKHPCRWKYAVSEVSRPGVYLPIEENDRGTFIFNSKDLCMLEYIPELIAAGVNSLKIEGRKKSALYVAAVTDYYRKILDGKGADVNREERIKQIFSRPWCKFHFNGKDKSVIDRNFVGHRGLLIGVVESVTLEFCSGIQGVTPCYTPCYAL